MTGLLQKFIRDDNGQGMVEYALIVALVAIGLISILTIFRNSIGNIFNHSRNELRWRGWWRRGWLPVLVVLSCRA
jgi:pilus assembly protein Flp/PilA